MFSEFLGWALLRGSDSGKSLDWPLSCAERWIGTLRRECLDHLLITGPRHLAAVLQEYIEHYNTHRPHRSLRQQPPRGATPSSASLPPLGRDRLGGLVHEYAQVD